MKFEDGERVIIARTFHDPKYSREAERDAPLIGFAGTIKSLADDVYISGRNNLYRVILDNLKHDEELGKRGTWGSDGSTLWWESELEPESETIL